VSAATELAQLPENEGQEHRGIAA